MIDVLLATNLSYVLHAPSTSAQVSDFVQRATRLRPSLRAATTRLARLDAAQLGFRIWVAPGAAPAFQSGDGIISLQLGAWELLPRVARELAADKDVAVSYIDAADAPAQRETFFRGEATLSLPPRGSTRWWFVALVLRPGDASLLLTATRLEVDADSAPDSALRAAAQPAEAALREHVLQWSPGRALWDRPAEESLPELAALAAAGD